jgi:1-deoxy-D-xylulose-5-phosphate reductoisomerase
MPETEILVTAIVGMIGIRPTIEGIKAGKHIALANKETLVTAGHIIMPLAKQCGVSILPVDSEHSAIFQSLQGGQHKALKKILLTASGGPFRGRKREDLLNIQVEDALKHPNWEMGRKITIDSSTLVNKGLEVTEAKWLYNTTFDKIDVIIHRESIIHSMVEYADGSTMAQMSLPTMELPIQLALLYPERVDFTLPRLDFSKLRTLSFEEVDNDRFPCFNLVVNASKKGGCYPAVANGANDALVELFLKDIISYNDIYRGIDGALNAFSGDYNGQFADLDMANTFARNFIKQKFGE